jgi:predicted DNA-binding transcriptional regulator AlpA
LATVCKFPHPRPLGSGSVSFAGSHVLLGIARKHW